MPWKRHAEGDRKRRTEDDRTQGDHTQGDHTQGDRSRGPSSVDSQATMKNFKAFGRYLFTDENILYILFILGRALCYCNYYCTYKPVVATAAMMTITTTNTPTTPTTTTAPTPTNTTTTWY